MTWFRINLPLAVLVFAASAAGQQAPAAPPDGVISGTVYDGVTRQPIAGVVVTLGTWGATASDDVSAARVTDEKGRFVFDGVGRARRSLTAHKPGYLESAYGRDGPVLGSFSGIIGGSDSTSRLGALAPVLLAPRQWLEGADLTLWPAASVSGTVRDEYGEPLVEQLVRVLAADPVAGYPRWSNVGTTVTDDRGRYFVGRLAPGRYVIAAPAAAPENAAGALRPGRYYPGMLRLADAQPVIVTAGARLTGFDIARLPTPASRVSGRVTGAANQNWPPLLLALTTAGDPDVGPTGYIATALLKPTGTFVFPRVPPGSYVIRTSPSVGTDPFSVGRYGAPIESFGTGPRWSITTSPDAIVAPYLAHTSVTVGEANVANVVVSLEQAVTLRGVLTTDVPPTDSRVATRQRFFAEPANPDAGPASATIQVDPTGAFAIDGLAPGAYFLRTAGTPTAIRSIVVGGREMLDQPIDVSQSLAGLTITTTGASSIHGDVRAGGTSASVRAVIYFPSDRQLWTQGSSKSPRFGSVYVNTDGTYDTFPFLPSGEYYVVAVARDTSFDGWRSDAFLEAAARVATTVRVDWAERTQQDLQMREVRLP